MCAWPTDSGCTARRYLLACVAVGSVFIDVNSFEEELNGPSSASLEANSRAPTQEEPAGAERGAAPAARGRAARSTRAGSTSSVPDGMQKMMRGWMHKSQATPSAKPSRRPSARFRTRFNSMSRDTQDAAAAAAASGEAGETEEERDRRECEERARKAAEEAKRKATSSHAWHQEQRVAAEVRLQTMWRIHMRGAPGLEAEMAKMQAGETAKQILREWEAEQLALKAYHSAAKEAEHDVRRRREQTERKLLAREAADEVAVPSSSSPSGQAKVASAAPSAAQSERVTATTALPKGEDKPVVAALSLPPSSFRGGSGKPSHDGRELTAVAKAASKVPAVGGTLKSTSSPLERSPQVTATPAAAPLSQRDGTARAGVPSAAGGNTLSSAGAPQLSA